jgi:hypothetical protein
MGALARRCKARPAKVRLPGRGFALMGKGPIVAYLDA